MIVSRAQFLCTSTAIAAGVIWILLNCFTCWYHLCVLLDFTEGEIFPLASGSAGVRRENPHFLSGFFWMYYLCIEETVIPVKEHFPVCSVKVQDREEQVCKWAGCTLYPKRMLCLPWIQKEESFGWNREITSEKAFNSVYLICLFSVSTPFICRAVGSVLQLPTPCNYHCFWRHTNCNGSSPHITISPKGYSASRVVPSTGGWQG